MKNLLSRTPRFSKNMRRKQILIGLFALIINRTIGEPKSLQGGTERAFVTMCFFRAVTGGTGISGVVCTGGTGTNGLSDLCSKIYEKSLIKVLPKFHVIRYYLKIAL